MGYSAVDGFKNVRFVYRKDHNLRFPDDRQPGVNLWPTSREYYSRRRGSLRGRKVQIQVSRAVELEGCCAVDLAHGNAQVPLVGVDAVRAVVRGDDGYGGEGRTVLVDNGKGLCLRLGGC